MSNLIITKDELKDVISDVLEYSLFKNINDMNDNIVSIEDTLSTYIEVANNINNEVSLFKHRDKMEWGWFVERSLRDINIIPNSPEIRENAREFVKNIVLPCGTYESVVVTDMFNKSKFKREIIEACILCKQAHPEWFR